MSATPRSRTRALLLGAAAAVVVAVVVALITYLPGRDERTPTDGASQTAPATPEPTPPSPSTAGPAPSAGFPDATTTGVPDGTNLVQSDKLTIDEDGTVIDGLEIHGNVVVEADDVVIRNSRIVMTSGKIAIRVKGDNFVMEDSEIDGQGRANPAIAYNGYTLRRVDIYNVAEGPRIAGGDVTIEDSYIHDLVQRGDNHTDVIQVMSGENIVVRGNNLQAYNPETGIYGNAAFMFGEDSGPVSSCTVEGNLMNGGNYTVNGGGSGTEGAACDFRNNTVQGDFRYGAKAHIGPNATWDDSNIVLGAEKPDDD
ncbi:hypothetical protein [Georgenia sp. SYP-B2076]|uniref:hypothetical protein n=1 Tax=Georgenia sp. SYP-B2076 TaxID=2495881 RepID=UPI000F8C7E30|nr:hypothetical protein [Georgenia sp. SYP-B2076]